MATKLRVAFNLLIAREACDKFEQITFEALSNNITEAFPYITVANDNAEDSYMVKRTESGYISGRSAFDVYRNIKERR